MRPPQMVIAQHRRLFALIATLLAVPVFAGDAIAVSFNKYRVPAVLSARAARDIEFHWSDTYTTFGVPLVPPGGGENDLDRLGIELCESVGQNPFGYPYTDIALDWDFFKANRAALYDPTPGNDPFLLNLPGVPANERNHVDAYIYMPAYGSDPPFPPYPNGDTGNGKNYGVFPSVFTSPDEDETSTVYHQNSLMVPGPRPSKVGDTGPNRWPRQSGGAISIWTHEFQHLMNQQAAIGGNPYYEFFGEAGQLVTGGVYQEPQYQNDVPYTWSFGRGDNYAAFRLFAAYLAYNFKGLSAASREDDLLWRWGGLGTRTLASLAGQLSNAACTECALRPYFNGLNDAQRLQLLLHNWRVANYVNQPALADGQYGYPTAFGYSPANDIGAWQDIDTSAEADNNVVVPASITADPTWRTREYSTLVHPANGAQHTSRPLRLEMYGSEYFVIHPAASLGTGGDTLVIRISADSLIRRGYVSPACTPPVVYGGRLFASAVTYSTDHDSLFRHPEWATGVTTQSVDVDSVARDIEFVVTGFASTNKAVLIVLSLADDDALQLASSSDLSGTAAMLPVRFSAALRRAPFLATNPTTLVQTPGVLDGFPTWSPDGTQIAFQSRIPSSGSYTQVYRVPVAGGSPTVVAAQPQNQLRPDWSPRGDMIAWEQDNGQPQTDIWVCNPNGTGLRKLTAHTGFAVNAAFGIDGQQVAYVYKPAIPNTPWELWRIQLDGTGAVRLAVLTADPQPGSLRWSPNGGHLYFTRNDSLYAVSANGGGAFSRYAVAPGAATVDFNLGNGLLAVGATAGHAYFEDCLCPFTCNPFAWDIPRTMPWTRVGVRDTAATGTGTRWRFSAPGVSAWYPRYSYDGTRIAYSADPNVAGDPELIYGSVSYNHAPTFTGVSATDAWVPACAQWNRYLSATDRDGEAITYRALKLPPGAQWISPNRIRWTPAQGELGDFYVVVRAEDPSGGVDSRVIKLTVADESACEDPCPPHIPDCLPAKMQTTADLPKEFALAPAEPNPAGEAALIRFSVPRREQVDIVVLDIQGRVIRRLVSGSIEPGHRTATWDRRDHRSNRVGAGVYFYRMRAGTFVARRKLILLP